MLERQGKNALNLEAVYVEYQFVVRKWCQRILDNHADSEDAAQNVWLTLASKLDTFHGDSAFSTWLHRVATNCALMHIRKNRHRRMNDQSIVEDSESLAGRYRSLQVRPDSVPERLGLDLVGSRLCASQREVLFLHDVMGYSHKETAQLQGISIGASKSYLFRAHQEMRKHLQA